MSGWILVEEKGSNGKVFVGVLNTANVLELDAEGDKFGRVVVEVYSSEGVNVSTLAFRDWKEFEKFLLMLPGVDQLGWLHVRDGKVLGAWRGSLEVLKKSKEAPETKELTPEEEAEVLEGEDLPEPETGCWDEDAGEFRQPCP